MTHLNLVLQKIQQYIQNDQYLITNHARIRMFERNITTDIIQSIAINGEIIEEYPVDKPYPSVLILGFWNEEPFHMVIALCEDHVRIITIYQPDKEKWIDYRQRKDLK